MMLEKTCHGFSDLRIEPLVLKLKNNNIDDGYSDFFISVRRNPTPDCKDLYAVLKVIQEDVSLKIMNIELLYIIEGSPISIPLYMKIMSTLMPSLISPSQKTIDSQLFIKCMGERPGQYDSNLQYQERAMEQLWGFCSGDKNSKEMKILVIEIFPNGTFNIDPVVKVEPI